MEEQTEQQFYERLNEIDDNDTPYWIMAHCICAISGGVVGLIIGYLLGRFGG